MALLEAEGYTVTQAHLSRGTFDVIGWRADGWRCVQVKYVSSRYPGFSKSALRDEMKAAGLPAGSTAELWILYKRGPRSYEWDIEVIVDGRRT